MTPRRRARLRRGAGTCLLASLAIASACAHIDRQTQLEILPRADLQPVKIGSGTQVVNREPVAKWVQSGPQLMVELALRQRCRTLTLVPVTRVEHTKRKASGHPLAWEFGLSAAFGGLAAFAFSAPTNFGGSARDGQGNRLSDPGAGYTAGGMFASVAALSLIAGVVDSARLRDTTRYADAYAPVLGAPCPCPQAEIKVAHTKLVLSTHGRQIEGTSDAQGRVHFTLPTAKAIDDAATRRIRGAVIIDPNLAVQVDFVVPYDAPQAQGHHGQVFSEAGP